ncbi:MAG: CPBP family intramembrane metalloprotease [Clostridia bacterium]|nr:CPBP family intramembrane metalloprotease [Clostridia bacterium]
MKKLYEKSEIWFAVAWIIVYVVVMGNLRGNFGDESLYSMLAALVMASVLTVFIVRNRLTDRFGLVLWTDSRKYLYFIPFVLLCTVNLWFGVSLHDSMGRQIVAVMTMALVAYVEEIIFRGLLYRAIEKDSVKQAIVISAITFGAGHIVNLLTGQGSLDTLLQMGYAIAIGFAFVMCFYKSGSLVPCIATHAIVNVTSKFSNHNIPEQAEMLWSYGSFLFIVLVAGGYALYLRSVPKSERIGR